MSDYKISTLTIRVMMFSMIVVGLSVFYGGLANSYGVTAPENMSDNLDASSDLATKAEAMKEGLTKNPLQGIPVVEYFYTGAAAAWSVLNLMAGTVNVIFSTMSTITSDLFLVPPWAGSMILTILVLVVAFAIASAYLRDRV